MTAPPEDATFALDPALDPQRIARALSARGRVEIRDFLAPGQAEALRRHLLGRPDWTLVLNAGDKVYEIPRARFAELNDAQRAQLDRSVIAAGRSGFQYRFESVRVPDDAEERARRAGLLDRFVDFLCSDEVVGFFRTVTGFGDIAFADGQATSYAPGHFLTCHDDAVEGKNRRAAYVFGLTPGWRAEYGGLLMFHGSDGNIEEAFTPAMGALRLFTVPAKHSVSWVAPFAPEPRLSVTGWLRHR